MLVYYDHFHLLFMLFMLGHNKLKQTPLIFSFCLVDTLDGVAIQNITSFRPDSIDLRNDWKQNQLSAISVSSLNFPQNKQVLPQGIYKHIYIPIPSVYGIFTYTYYQNPCRQIYHTWILWDLQEQHILWVYKSPSQQLQLKVLFSESPSLN